MKLLNKTIIGGTAFIVTAGIAGTIISMNKPAEPQTNVVKSSETTQKVQKTSTETVDLGEIKPVEVVNPTDVVVVEEPKIVVLSTQEYGIKYLDLSTPLLQQCFDAIIERWPERFTEDVREDNVKALRAWASTCTTGILAGRQGASNIERYGINGEFFDSQLANAVREQLY